MPNILKEHRESADEEFIKSVEIISHSDFLQSGNMTTNYLHSRDSSLLSRIRKEVEGIELPTSIAHEAWCDLKTERARCNCSQSDLYYLIEDIKKFLQILNEDE